MVRQRGRKAFFRYPLVAYPNHVVVLTSRLHESAVKLRLFVCLSRSDWHCVCAKSHTTHEHCIITETGRMVSRPAPVTTLSSYQPASRARTAHLSDLRFISQSDDDDDGGGEEGIDPESTSERMRRRTAPFSAKAFTVLMIILCGTKCSRRDATVA